MFQQFQSPNYASFGLRVLAYIIDSLLMMVIFVPLGLVLGVTAALGGEQASEEMSAAASALINLLSMVVSWLYSAILESSPWQATVGKKVLGLTVTDLSGNRIGFGRATGRYFGKFISSMICLIGFIMAAFTEKKQGLHDILASTLVLKDAPPGGVTLNQAPPPPPDFRYGG